MSSPTKQGTISSYFTDSTKTASNVIDLTEDASPLPPTKRRRVYESPTSRNMEVQKASSMATSATKKARSHATKGSSSKPPRRKSSGPKPFPTIDEDEDEIPLERAARIQSMRKKHSFHDTSLPSVSPNPQRNEGGAAAKTVIPSRKQKRSAIKDKAVNETSNNEELEVDGQAWTPLERQVEILKVYSYYQFISKSIGSTIEK